METKYKARLTSIDNIRFDSHAEANRYTELKMLLQAKEIFDLQVHPTFVIWKMRNQATGKEEKIKYIADFSYTEKDGTNVVEDVKGVKTAVYKIKRKMFTTVYPYTKFIEINV